MNITWFIGNGFDSNLGLKTSYPDFRERVYLSDSFSSRLRDDLLKRINAATLDEKLDDARLWSDLERLLGEVSKLYGQGEEDEFSATFEEMEKLLTQMFETRSCGYRTIFQRNVLKNLDFQSGVSTIE